MDTSNHLASVALSFLYLRMSSCVVMERVAAATICNFTALLKLPVAVAAAVKLTVCLAAVWLTVFRSQPFTAAVALEGGRTNIISQLAH